jgi:hypothetical protein
MRSHIVLTLAASTAALSCLDETGAATDWWIALKNPGSGAYWYVNGTTFMKSSHTLEAFSGGAVMNTVNQVLCYAANVTKQEYMHT